MVKTCVRCGALAVAILVMAGFDPVQAQKWEATAQDSQHWLKYSASAPLLGHPTPFSIAFHCDPKSGNDVFGTLGFDVSVKDVAELKQFPFDDFEGPDAPVAAKVEATIINAKGDEVSIRTQASGGYSSADTFCFGIADLSKDAKSPAKSILRALAEPGVETLQITIADPRDPKLKLEFGIAIAGRQKEFETLLTGLK